jgi:Sec-independent protein translocase protein TatA
MAKHNYLPKLQAEAIAFIKQMAHSKNGKQTGPIGSHELAKRLDHKAQRALNEVVYYNRAIKRNMRALYPVTESDKKEAPYRLGRLPEDAHKVIREFQAAVAADKEHDEKDILKELEKQHEEYKRIVYRDKKSELNKQHFALESAQKKVLLTQYALYLHNSLMIGLNGLDFNLRYNSGGYPAEYN